MLVHTLLINRQAHEVDCACAKIKTEVSNFQSIVQSTVHSTVQSRVQLLHRPVRVRVNWNIMIALDPGLNPFTGKGAFPHQAQLN